MIQKGYEWLRTIMTIRLTLNIIVMGNGNHVESKRLQSSPHITNTHINYGGGEVEIEIEEIRKKERKMAEKSES